MFAAAVVLSDCAALWRSGQDEERRGLRAPQRRATRARKGAPQGGSRCWPPQGVCAWLCLLLPVGSSSPPGPRMAEHELDAPSDLQRLGPARSACLSCCSVLLQSAAAPALRDGSSPVLSRDQAPDGGAIGAGGVAAGRLQHHRWRGGGELAAARRRVSGPELPRLQCVQPAPGLHVPDFLDAAGRHYASVHHCERRRRPIARGQRAVAWWAVERQTR